MDLGTTEGTVQSESTPVTNQAPQSTTEAGYSQPQVEKMLPQSKVDEIVKERLREKEARIRREYEEKGTYNSSAQSQNLGGVQQISDEKLQKMVAEAAQKHVQDQAQLMNGQRVVNEFVSRMNAGKEKYSDFDDVVTPLNLPTIPHIVQLAHGVDNTADVMYELGRNPEKIATLTTLFHTAPHLAQIAMTKISNSIKANSEAESQPKANAPLSTVKSTNTGTDNGKRTVSDLRRETWLRA